ncbi:SsgA family sporulation/cell division regulator [Streptomyces durbertensis]|uniref:SsgA family sporulation/cell division regulator n=1 Tax=Streptomyces durbertensis TaxID=2448886 RepID=A0ABR6EB62_9ACTN|nr:SsgA family sporulation/cell division regulator [Streptomyces durbertensis]MBB1242413.1 SsgA family sporulation/cell division regulator [Streptomyces durbertensis]
MPTTITHRVRAEIVAEAARRFTARLRYDASDPHAVRIVFPAAISLDGTETTWAFARDLLADGLLAPAGAGAVRIWPGAPGELMLELGAPEGVAVVALDAADAAAFVRASHAVVPPGEELGRLDFDEALAGLLRSA